MKVRPAASLSRIERALLYAAMLLSPVLLLVLAEVGLRVAGYGDDYPLFVPVEGREDYLYQSRDVARRYFAALESIPTSLLDFFPAEKEPGTFRIFVQGGSSAAGFPFYYGGAFSRMLEQRLAQTYPGRRIEVVNTAMAAVNSYTLLDLVPEILAQKPDAILVYAGHNEYYGALGVGSSESFGRLPWIKRGYLRMRRLRTVQALRGLFSWVAGALGGTRPGEAPNYTMMSQMVGEQQIPLGSTLYRDGLTQFESNLDAIVEAYRARGVPVYLGTLVSNEGDHRPFIGAPNDEAAAAFEQGMDALGRGDLDAARSAFEVAVRADSLAADPWFALGKIEEQEGNYEAARRAYLAAKDRDALRFRAPEAMNRIIREIAARRGAQVVDVQQAFADRSPRSIVGENLMTEHLHPNVDGYFAMADAFYDSIVAARLIADQGSIVADTVARREVLLTPVDSLAGMMRIRRLKAAWPFQPMGVVDRSADTLTPRNPVEQIALELTSDRVNWLTANNQLLRYFQEEGDFHHALQAALAQLQEFPFIPDPYLHAGSILVRQRRLDEALEYFRNALAIEESALAHRMIGSIALERGNRTEAIGHLEASVRLNPEDATALYNLAGAYALEGRYDAARQYAQRALAFAPNHRDARRLLESLPATEQ